LIENLFKDATGNGFVSIFDRICAWQRSTPRGGKRGANRRENHEQQQERFSHGYSLPLPSDLRVSAGFRSLFFA
jgi:hypothetical protein